jgi:hypothetical protein
MALYQNVNSELREGSHFYISTSPQSIASATATDGPWVDMKEVRRFGGKALVTDASDGTTLTVKIQEATDNSGTGAQALTTVTVTADGTQDLMGIVEIRETEMSTDDGYTYVNLQFQHDEGSALDCAAIYSVLPYKHQLSDTKSTDTV